MKIETLIKDWIHHLSTSYDKLGNIPVCPFSKNADYIIKQCSIKDISSPFEKHELIIFVVEDDVSYEELLIKAKELNETYKDLVFLPDHRDRNTYINTIQTNNGHLNLILCQDRVGLEQARSKLQKTLYYSFWDKEYLNEILNT